MSSMYFRNYLPLENSVAFHLHKPKPPLVPSLVEIRPIILEKILKFCQCIFAISLLSLFGKGHGPSFHSNELGPPSPKNALCQVRLKLAKCFWRRNF